MKQITLSIFFLFFLCIITHAQRSAVIFYHQNQGKSVQLVRGTMVVLEYQGYLKQMELNTNNIIAITDSTVILGKPQVFAAPRETKEIRINDITGFRKISAGSQLLKTALTIGATLGTYYAIRENGDNLSSTRQILYSTGAGLAARFSLNLIFPDKKIKHRMQNGWKVLTR